MAVKFGNNAATLLAANASSSTTTLTVDDGAVFPTLSGADYTYITLEDAAENREVVKLTAVSSNTLTVVRAQDGTSARAFAIADKCELRITAALLNGIAPQTVFVDEDNMASDSASLVPTQQSVKAYVDAVGASTQTNTTNIAAARAEAVAFASALG